MFIKCEDCEKEAVYFLKFKDIFYVKIDFLCLCEEHNQEQSKTMPSGFYDFISKKQYIMENVLE